MADTFSGLLRRVPHAVKTMLLRQDFKAQLLQESAQPDASIAGVAHRHGINANLLQKWIRLQRVKTWPLRRKRPGIPSCAAKPVAIDFGN